MTDSSDQRPLPFDESRFPLSTPALIERRVESLVGPAAVRQLWLMFLDGENIQLPLIVPIDGFPRSPMTAWTEAIAALAGESAHEAGAASIVLVWERPDSPRLAATEISWLGCLAEAFSGAGVTVSQTVLSHRDGVRLVASGEYENPTGASSGNRESTGFR